MPPRSSESLSKLKIQERNQQCIRYSTGIQQCMKLHLSTPSPWTGQEAHTTTVRIAAESPLATVSNIFSKHVVMCFYMLLNLKK